MPIIVGHTRPLRNRVTPFGDIVATPERGLLMGNRGCLHDDHGTIVRHSRAQRWISCTPTWPGTRRQLMAPGRYTELFFPDEPTALAAGHRPCWQCRQDAFVAFATAWARASRLDRLPTAVEMDAALHVDRGKRALVDPTDLPDGAIIAAPDGNACWLIDRGAMRRWSFGGYGPLEALPDAAMIALTPPSIFAALKAGYVPLQVQPPSRLVPSSVSARPVAQ
jgi:hypothetical protein